MAENKPDKADNKPEMAGNEHGAREAAANGNFQDASVEIARLRSELQDASDGELRAQAELDNYRKRARRELEDERRYANVPLLRDLLPVLDNMQRAINAAEKTPDATGLLEGIRMVAQSLEATLTRYHCRRIEALGKAFDPAVHEAIAQQPSADHPTHTVLAVAHDGYMVHERVVRPAQVVVSVAP